MSTAIPPSRAAGTAAAPTSRRTVTHTEKGISLSRGPALVLGTILTAVGLYLLYKAHTFPKFANFPNGTAHADGSFLFGIFGANGWTAMLTAVGGGLLLFGAAQHLLAKTMSLIVGVAFGAAAVLGLINSGTVVGMAATNHLTELGWAVCAVILLFNTLVPRRTRTVEVAGGTAVADDELSARHRPLPPRRARRDEPVGEPSAFGSGEARAAESEAPTTAYDRGGGEAPTTAHDRTATEAPATGAPMSAREPAATTPQGENVRTGPSGNAATTPAGGSAATAPAGNAANETPMTAHEPLMTRRDPADSASAGEAPTTAHDRAAPE